MKKELLFVDGLTTVTSEDKVAEFRVFVRSAVIADVPPYKEPKRNVSPCKGGATEEAGANNPVPGCLTRSISIPDQRRAVGVWVVSGEGNGPFPGEVAFDKLYVARRHDTGRD